MRVDHDQSDLKTEPKDQLSQGGSQINIIADKTHAITIITIINNTRTQCLCRPKPIFNKKDEISKVMQSMTMNRNFAVGVGLAYGSHRAGGLC